MGQIQFALGPIAEAIAGLSYHYLPLYDSMSKDACVAFLDIMRDDYHKFMERQQSEGVSAEAQSEPEAMAVDGADGANDLQSFKSSSIDSDAGEEEEDDGDRAEWKDPDADDGGEGDVEPEEGGPQPMDVDGAEEAEEAAEEAQQDQPIESRQRSSSRGPPITEVSLSPSSHSAAEPDVEGAGAEEEDADAGLPNQVR